MAAIFFKWLLLGGLLRLSSAQDACMKTDGSGPCCYNIAVGFPGPESRFGAPLYQASPLHGSPKANGSTKQPIAYGYSLDHEVYMPQNDHGSSNWGWGVQDNGEPVFGFMETHQFVFPAEASIATELQLTVNGQSCGSSPADKSPAYRALWQGGSGNVQTDTWPSVNNTLKVNYSNYIAAEAGHGKRQAGDPIYITLVPCNDKNCEQFDSFRAIVVMISFRAAHVEASNPLTACDGDFDGGSGNGYDCCYIDKSIKKNAKQSEIDDSVWVNSYGSSVATSESCIKQPHWQCFDSQWRVVGADPSAGDAAFLQYKGSLVDFVLDKRRKPGQGLRVVLGDLVTLDIALSTTYVEYTVDSNAPQSCNMLCQASNGYPSDADVSAYGSTCQLSAVSSFAAVNGGMLSVGGFGRIDGYTFLDDPTYFSNSPGFFPQLDSTPGNDCPSCNRFCAWSPYAQGMHVLATCCNLPMHASECPSSTLLTEAGDARYHIDSGLLELSSNSNSKFAVDIADITVANPLKRGDGSVMIQSPGHFVRNDGCSSGTRSEQEGLQTGQPPCSGPNMPARAFGLKYVGAWHDAADGPSMKSENSEYIYTFVHNTDDCLKPYSNSIVRDSTVIHGGVGGVVTPCTYNLLGYTPGCSGTQTLNTHVVRNLDPTAGYDGRGGILATRYCAGKSNLLWSNLAPQGKISGNLVDGLKVERLANLNQNGRGVAVVVDAPQNGSPDAPVWFCSAMYEPLFLKLEPGAFVFKNWDFDLVESGGLSGGAALISSKHGSTLSTPPTSLTQFGSGSSVDVSGLALNINDGLGCDYSGVYFPCLWSSADKLSLGCHIQQFNGSDKDSSQSFASLEKGKGPCKSWQMSQTIACESLDLRPDSDCGQQVVFPYSQEREELIV